MNQVFVARHPGVVARRHASAVIAAGLVLAPAAAFAADAAAADAPAAVDGVIVTASASGYQGDNSLTKLPAALKDTPQSVTVLNHNLLQAQGVSSLSEALKNVPGITIGGAEGGQIGNNINLNGFTARTDIYMDGFRDRGQYYRDTFALDSVEVLMGPSSMLFGRGSTGGAINQVSKKAGLMPSTSVALSDTTNGLARGVADLDAPLSDKSAFRISVMGQEGAASTRRKTTVEDYGVAPTYSWGIGADTQVNVLGLIQHNNDRPDYGQPPLNGQPAKVGYDTVYGYSSDRTVQDVKALSGEVKHRFSGGITLRDQVQFNGVDTDAIETAPQGIGLVSAKGYTALSPAGVSSLPLSALFVQLQSHDRVIHDRSLFNQAEASGEFTVIGLNNQWLAGTEFGHDDYANQGLSRTGSCNGVALKSGYTSCTTLLSPGYPTSPVTTEVAGNLAGGKADTAADYVNDTLTLIPQLKLVGGVRYDRYSATVTNSVNSANTLGNTSFAKISQTVGFTSVRAGAIWQPTKAQSYYASYSTSFNPSLEQLTSTTGISQPLPPETNTAYEVGGKWDLLNDQLDLTAAAFQITQDNSRSQNADNTYTANGTIRVQGFRLGASGKITRRLSVFGGYSHLDAKIIDAIAAGTQGMVPANTAKDSATLWATYDVGHGIEAGGGAIYLGQRYLNNTDTVSVPGYTRWDATVAWRQPHYEVRLNVFNLFDARYYDSLIQSDGGRAVPGAGRTAMISLVWKQ
ncbi:MAG TPA: TonB-dependent siderophore receptor [Caulobacteraceae bacterium]